MKLVYLTILTLSLLSCETEEMKITQIEDTYAKKNGERPNENIFLIENFKNNKEGIQTIFSYIKDTIINKMMPFKRENGSCTFIFHKSDVDFDDAQYYINGKNISVYLNEENVNYFNSIHVHGYKNLPYTLKGTSDIIIDYETLDLNVFKTFLDVIETERKKIKYNYTTKQFEVDGEKVKSLKQEYQLINSREFTLECTINYEDVKNFTVTFK